MCNLKISSFNLGSQATFAPQSYYLYEEFLKSNLCKNVQFCFLELTHISQISDFFYHREQTNYWLNLKELKFVLDSFKNNPNLPKERKEKQITRYIVSFIENKLNWGHYGEHFIKNNFYDKRYLCKKENGFFSMDLDYKTTNEKFIKDHYKNINEEMYKDTSTFLRNFEITKKIYDEKLDDYDKVHMSRLLRLINKSKNKGINLIFIVSPRNSSKELIKFLKIIPDENKIDMGLSINEFLPFYYLENSFDRGHLNERGANIYSQKLAKKFAIKICN